MMRAKRGFIYSFLMVCFLITGCSKEKVIPEEYTVEYGDEKNWVKYCDRGRMKNLLYLLM